MAKWKIDLAENFPLGESSFPNPTLPGVVIRLTTRNSIAGGEQTNVFYSMGCSYNARPRDSYSTLPQKCRVVSAGRRG